MRTKPQENKGLKSIIPRIAGLTMIVLVSVHCGGDEGGGPPAGPAVPKDPAIALSRTAVIFNAQPGGSVPAMQPVDVTNGGGGTLSGIAVNIAYSNGNGWLSATLNQNTAPAAVTIRPTTTSLSAGTHRATVSVTSAGADNSPVSIAVTYEVSAAPLPPVIDLSKSTVTFNAAEGSNPMGQTVIITNDGGGTLSGLSSSLSYAGGQPTGWLSANLLQTTAPAALSLSAATSGLAVGTYNATITVSSPVASNSPVTIGVTATVTAAAPTTGTVVVHTSTTGSNVDPDGYSVRLSGAGFLRTESVSATGLVNFYDVPAGACTATLQGIESNCAVNGGQTSQPVVVAAGQTHDLYFNLTCQAPTRRVTLINNMSAGLNIHDIVQIKVAATEAQVYTRNDLLTNDPAQCLSLPGESVPPGSSTSIDINVNTYAMFIGIGIWDMDNFSCNYQTPWFKRRFFTDVSYQIHYVWAVVLVNGHDSGDWNWTISGSYLNGTLKVTPANNTPIYFNVTTYNPIP